MISALQRVDGISRKIRQYERRRYSIRRGASSPDLRSGTCTSATELTGLAFDRMGLLCSEERHSSEMSCIPESYGGVEGSFAPTKVQESRLYGLVGSSASPTMMGSASQQNK